MFPKNRNIFELLLPENKDDKKCDYFADKFFDICRYAHT